MCAVFLFTPGFTDAAATVNELPEDVLAEMVRIVLVIVYLKFSQLK